MFTGRDLAETLAHLMEHSRSRKPFCDFCGRWTESLDCASAKSPNGAVVCQDCALTIVENLPSKAGDSDVQQ